MRKNTLLTRITSIAVCFGILISNAASGFDGIRSQIARDVELSRQGGLSGHVCSPAGIPISNAAVQLKYQGTIIAETTTNDQGNFLITGVRGGAHDLNVGSVSTQLRLWKSGTAPEGAGDDVTIAASEFVVRGQYQDANPSGAFVPYAPGFGFMTFVTLASVAVATTAIVIAVEAQNDVDNITPASP